MYSLPKQSVDDILIIIFVGILAFMVKQACPLVCYIVVVGYTMLVMYSAHNIPSVIALTVLFLSFALDRYTNSEFAVWIGALITSVLIASILDLSMRGQTMFRWERHV
jgi:hypothetical protein